MWRAWLWLAAWTACLLGTIAALVLGLLWDGVSHGIGIAMIVCATLGCAFAGIGLLLLRLNIDPAHRRSHHPALKEAAEKSRAQARRRKPAASPVRGRKYWMRRLADRLARLERLVNLDAPEIIVECERKLVRDAIAKLDESDARAVLAAWPRAAGLREPRGAQVPAGKRDGTDKPN